MSILIAATTLPAQHCPCLSDSTLGLESSEWMAQMLLLSAVMTRSQISHSLRCRGLRPARALRNRTNRVMIFAAYADAKQVEARRAVWSHIQEIQIKLSMSTSADVISSRVAAPPPPQVPHETARMLQFSILAFTSADARSSDASVQWLHQAYHCTVQSESARSKQRAAW